MGYSCHITSDKEITEAELDIICANVPEELKSFFPGCEKQSWGWSLACDIQKPQGNTMYFRGSYSISGEKIKPMRAWLKKELKKNGHKLTTKMNW